MADLLIRLVTKFDGKGLNDAKSKLKTALGTGLKAGAVGAAGAIAAVGTAATVAGIEAVKFADQSKTAMNELSDATGISGDELSQYKEVGKALFASGFGEDFNDVAGVLTTIAQNTNASAGEIDDLAKRAIVLRDRFDKDIAGSIRTVDALIKNNLAKDAEEAFDIIVAGIQGGLDKSGDFLDTLNEYSQDFGDLGFTADETMAVLNSGLEAGIFNTDRIADSINEAFINLKDPAIIEKLGEIDEGTAAIAQQFASGAISGREAFTQIQAGLAGIEDPVKRNAAGVEIYRSLWEDLGESAVLSLSAAGDEFSNLEGTSDQALKQNLSIGESFSNLGRQIMVALEPAAAELLPLLGSGIEIAGNFLREAAPTFGVFAGDLKNTLGPAIEIIFDALSRIGIALGLATEETTGMDFAVGALKVTLDLVVTAIKAVAVGFDLAAEAIEKARVLYDSFVETASQTIDAGIEFGSGAVGAVGDFLGFDEGGVVPGPRGQPRLVVAHAGETILPTHKEGGAGETVVIGGESFMVANARRLGAAIDQHMNNMFQEYTDQVLVGVLEGSS